MNYKNLYKELATNLASLGCVICDADGLGYTNHINGYKAFIYIKSTLNFKHKYFVLAHEAGHLFYMKKGNAFNWSKKPKNEKEANFFAVQLIRLAGVDVQEYYVHYNKALEKSKNRKKTWFEI